MPMTQTITVTNEETGEKEEVVLQEVSRTVLTEENLVGTILARYINDATTVEDIIVELKSNNII